MKKTVSRILLLAAGLLTVVGCGSGSAVNLPQNKTGKIVFSATNPVLSAPVTSIQIKAKLPDGVTVTLKAKLPGDTGLEQSIDPGSIKGLIANSVVTGTYLASAREISLTVTPQLPVVDFGTGNVGNFAEVTLSCSTSVTKELILSSNPDLSGNFIVKGFDSNSGSTVTLTGLIPSMDVTL